MTSRSKIYEPQTSNISRIARLGDYCKIHSHVSIHDDVSIGNNCKIEAYVFIPNGVTIQDNCFIGPHVCFTNDRSLKEPFEISRTLVKQGAKIGANSSILAGVTIGKNSIVGMGSVVLKDIPDSELWVGNPASFIRALG